MTRVWVQNAAVLLLLGAVWVPMVSAGFDESFQPLDKADGQAIRPGLWQQTGDVNKGDGRGTGTNRAAMQLTRYRPTAETVLLKWDGTQDKLRFWYYSNQECDTGSLRVSMSCDAEFWFPVAVMKTTEMQVNAYNIARISLPLNATCPAFAVRWDLNQGACSYQTIDLDDITFPAQPPGAAAPLSPPSPTGGESLPPPAPPALPTDPREKQPDTEGKGVASSTSGGGSAASATGGKIELNMPITNSRSWSSSVQVAVGWLLVPVLCLCALVA